MITNDGPNPGEDTQERFIIHAIAMLSILRQFWAGYCVNDSDNESENLKKLPKSEQGYGYMPPKGPQAMVETILFWSVRKSGVAINSHGV